MLYILAFTIGSLQRVYINFVGRLPSAELCYVGFGPLLILLRREAFRIRETRVTLILGALWLISQVVSDLFNSSTPADFYRGWANIGMIVLAFASWTAILHTQVFTNYGLYLAGLVVSGVYFVGTGQADPNVIEWWGNKVAPWSLGLVLLVAWWLYLKKYCKTSALFAITYGITSVIFNARSHGLGFISMGALIITVQIFQRNQFVATKAWLFKFVCAALIGCAVLFVAYVSLGLRGYLGQSAQEQLIVLRHPYNPIHVVLRARTEGLAAIRAIIDKPILGHGSWARDMKYVDYKYDLLASITKPSAKIVRPVDERDLIPGHSHVLQAWVQSGFLGALFWIYQIILFTRVFAYFLRRPWHPALPIVLYAVWAVYWNIFFSPFGFGRVMWPALAAFCLVCKNQVETYEKLTLLPDDR